jgi:glycosyltransferase involved in cell wall biosynthesis
MNRRVAIDITSLLDVKFVSGIQRVVREILIRMLSLRTKDADFILLYYDESRHELHRVSVSDFLCCYRDKSENRVNWERAPLFSFASLVRGDVYFALDSVWNNRMRSSFLFPILKRQNVRILVHIYDIIPVLYPQYCDRETTVRFLDYLGATLLYADRIVANTSSTLEDVKRLCVGIGTECPQGNVVPLGSDFSRIRPLDSKAVPEHSLSRYLLLVGTIEPRKNHAFLLDLYEKSLREAGFSLVFVGRPGWNVEKLMARIRDLNATDSHFRYYDNADDALVSQLYQDAFFTVFPTQYEGYGLPIIESICRGTPVVASDIPVLREVGGSYSLYFPLDDPKILTNLLLQYTENPDLYRKLKDSLSTYLPISWDQSEEEMWAAISSLLYEETI